MEDRVVVERPSYRCENKEYLLEVKNLMIKH